MNKPEAQKLTKRPELIGRNLNKPDPNLLKTKLGQASEAEEAITLRKKLRDAAKPRVK